jgi:hypothetical protein
MSGGTFDYNQYRIRDIANRIKEEIYNSGREKTKKEIEKEIRDWYPDHKPDSHHYAYPKEVVEEFVKAYKILRVAEIYAHRIDWLLAGDDGEETFMERLQQDMLELDRELEYLKNNGFRTQDEIENEE